MDSSSTEEKTFKMKYEDDGSGGDPIRTCFLRYIGLHNCTTVLTSYLLSSQKRYSLSEIIAGSSGLGYYNDNLNIHYWKWSCSWVYEYTIQVKWEAGFIFVSCHLHPWLPLVLLLS